MIKKIVVFGASITSSPWWTWKDFLEMESGLPVIDLSRRGAGNEYMTNSLLGANIDEHTLVVGMLTNVDKFDWYVEDEQFRDLQQEKHRPIPVGKNSGFWCTGSWFPGKKEIYKEHFFSLDYFCTKTIQQTLLIKNICKYRSSRVEIFFDSPVWNYTDQQLNDWAEHGKALEKVYMLDLPLSSQWKILLDDRDINLHDTSLIGYCIKNNLPWHNRFYKGHPPSSSHWRYYNDIMKSVLQKELLLVPQKNIQEKIGEMDRLWKKNA
jgi:hypothetical protein